MVGPPGLEPGTDRLWAGCSNQLSYRPMTFDRKSRTAKVMREMQNIVWSGKRDSNSRPPPWQGDALPTELFPHHADTREKMATRRGLEPLTSAVTGRHSNQLNYRAVILFSHLRDNNWNYSEYKAHCQHFFKKILKPKKNDSEHKSLTVIPAFTTH